MTAPGVRLRTVLWVCVALAQVLAVFVLSLPVLEGQDTIIYEQARQMARARARLGAAFLEQDLPRLSRRELDAALAPFLTSPDIVEARLVERGRVVAALSAQHPPPAGAAPPPAPLELRDRERGFSVHVPLRANGDACLEFDFSTAQLGRQIQGVTVRVLGLVCVALATGLFGAYALSLRLVARLERAAHVTASVAQGDLARRLTEDGPFELACLGRSFNAMVDAVAATRAKLVEANETLERRVAERTRQLIEAQQELVEGERLLTVGQMSAQLAHDLRNPLASAALSTELLSDELAGCDCSRRTGPVLRTLERSLARADRALAEYLGFTGLDQVQRVPADLGAAITAELASIAEWLASRRIATVLDLAPDLPPVLLESRRFRLGFRCLVRHALDAMSGGGTLTVSTRAADGAVHLRVADTGGALEESVQKDLFKLFCGRRPNSGGPGLRLAREIIEIHGGSLDLERSDAGGSTFLIVLPLPTSGSPTLGTQLA